MNTYVHGFRNVGRHILAYPKFLLLFITILIAYLIFLGRISQPLNNFILSAGYFGVFLAGIFFTYGFTAAPATALLLLMAERENMIAAGLIGGLGALIGDLLIFSFIRVSFADEIEKLSHETI